MKCADVAKEFVNDFPRLQLNALYGAVNYADKFKACEDFPHIRVVETTFDLSVEGQMPMPFGHIEMLRGKKWNAVFTLVDK